MTALVAATASTLVLVAIDDRPIGWSSIVVGSGYAATIVPLARGVAVGLLDRRRSVKGCRFLLEAQAVAFAMAFLLIGMSLATRTQGGHLGTGAGYSPERAERALIVQLVSPMTYFHAFVVGLALTGAVGSRGRWFEGLILVGPTAGLALANTLIALSLHGGSGSSGFQAVMLSAIGSQLATLLVGGALVPLGVRVAPGLLKAIGIHVSPDVSADEALPPVESPPDEPDRPSP